MRYWRFDEFQQQGSQIDKKLIGECMARNIEKPIIGMKMKNRMDERPEDSLEQWVEWIATKEQEWKSGSVLPRVEK